MVFACKTATLASELQVSMGPSPHLWFCAFTTATWINSPHGSQTSPVVVCMQNSVISTRNTSLHEFLTSPVVLCMQNNVISIRITSLYGTQPSSVVFVYKTATFGSELQASIRPSHHLWFCAFITMWLVSELLVSMGPNPRLWFLHVKQRILDQNYKPLWVPAIICGFVHSKQCD